ncbi:MAG: hypothetical protein COW63_00480 [Bacteroidetes bacterium CG18_big_fil_WC_8_21_14_2_50_41_14]|nr:MAG: hypothetical protein COW63_00480 [Bacteroidetes bacterium CG18_big_fil_WC_8_21_14_2_50_41_14]
MTELPDNLIAFGRSLFLNSENRITTIGNGSIGGKATGLARINQFLNTSELKSQFDRIDIGIPAMTVIRTDVFDAFMKRNKLYDISLSGLPDDRIAHAFQKAALPMEILGDLRALIAQVHSPLAIRSSSMLEDALGEPFAGIYGTKMTPNNQPDTTTRFNKLVEAIKYVYASTFFKVARDYVKATQHTSGDEKMALIIQEVVGLRHGDRFYPECAGVARSRNYYAFGNASPTDGIVSLALGLGKTVVDGGLCWSYSPAFPKADPPVGSVYDLLKITQTKFWAVNMGTAPAYDPLKETEYLAQPDLEKAEEDKTLRWVASTLDPHSGRLVMGVGKNGARLLNFAPLLRLDDIPFNQLIIHLLHLCEQDYGTAVEIEFAMTFAPGQKPKFGFLQVRPMVVSTEEVEVNTVELKEPDVLCSSPKVLGNGINNDILDIVYMKPGVFDASLTQKIALEIDHMNELLCKEKKPYLLIGFGRWGTSDAWAGIPVNWGQISGAKTIVEAPLAGMNSELSQGSHFFHNVTSFRVLYFSVPYSGEYPINWDWLNSQHIVNETEAIKHVRLQQPLSIKVDGRSGRGVIQFT